MKRKKRSEKTKLDYIDPKQFGVSFSLKQCRSFDISPRGCLEWLIRDMGFRRFRLMSYWNEHEKVQGTYDFRLLDAQIAIIEKAGGEITLCLGARQPRWPENHWPDWAWKASKAERTDALLKYVAKVVDRYRDKKVIVSWQLENEALLKKFGKRAEVDRKRLRKEFKLVAQLDASRPIIMTTSNGWGVPIRKPIPDKVGFSYYPIMYVKDRYVTTIQKPWLHKFRKRTIRILWRRRTFIHELQCEPWGPTAIWKMPAKEQDKSMSVEQIGNNIRAARKIKAAPIDLWGGEWWYWRYATHNDPSIAEAVTKAITS